MIIKKRIKYISAILALVMLVLLSSCGAVDADTGKDKDSEFFFSSLEVAAPDSSIKDSINVVYPTEFTVLCENGTELDMFVSADAGDVLSRTVFERNALLFEQYGITLIEERSDDIASRVANDIMAEDKGYDMLLLSAKTAPSLIMSGAMADLGSIAGFSSDASGYSSRVIEGVSIGGRYYLTAGDATPSLVRSASAMLINTELAKIINSDVSIFTMAKNGHFTYETMLKMSSAIAELDSSENQSSAFAIRLGAEDAISLFFSGGGKFFEVNDVTDVLSSADFDGDNLEIYKSIMSLYGISDDNPDYTEKNGNAAVTPLFTVSSIGEFEALAAEKAPFALLPMPKMSVIQADYHCGIDLSKAVFTALPKGSGETEVAVMNLIYSTSDGIRASMLDICDPDKRGMSELVYKNMDADVLTLFGFGDLPSLLASCVNEAMTAKAFSIKAAERSTAATAALSIISEKLAADG